MPGPTGFTPPYPTAVMPAPATKPPSRWKRWHKVTLGVIGALLLFFCGIAIFAPSPEAPEKTTAVGASPKATRQVTDAAPLAAPVRTSTTPKPKPKPKSPTPKPVSYADCEEVAAAGKAPIRKGQPGFQKKFDLDADGKGCELNGDDDPLLQDDEDDEDEDSDPDDGGGTDPRFSSCAKANAAGYGPYREGSDPEYDWYQDRDSDGVVCE